MGFGGYANLDLLSPDIINELKKESLEFLEKSKQYHGGENIKTLVEEGRVAETILQVTKKLNADIIVMGLMADDIVKSGMRDAGYTYLVLNDGWMAKERECKW